MTVHPNFCAYRNSTQPWNARRLGIIPVAVEATQRSSEEGTVPDSPTVCRTALDPGKATHLQFHRQLGFSPACLRTLGRDVWRDARFRPFRFPHRSSGLPEK
jgi:hypothetical protein